MKRLTLLTLIFTFVAGLTFAQTPANDGEKVKEQIKNKNEHEYQYKFKRIFVDENGDGFNDLAKDSDGDGIPNGRDEDFDAQKMRNGNGSKGFVDEDGDGLNDNAFDSDGDGIPNGKDEDWIRPEDGTGRKIRTSYDDQGKGLKNRIQVLGDGTCDGPQGEAVKIRKGKNK